MSLTDVNWNQADHSLELTTRFFTDDVERAISSHGTPFKIDESMDQQILPLIEDFYVKNLSVKGDAGELDLKFLGFEVENELIWCYAEILDHEESEGLTFQSTWLLDLFEDQVNIINVHIGDVKSAYLNNDERSHFFKLK